MSERRRGREEYTWVTGVSASCGVMNQEMVGVGKPSASQGSLAVLPAMASVMGAGWCRKNGLELASVKKRGRARVVTGQGGGRVNERTLYFEKELIHISTSSICSSTCVDTTITHLNLTNIQLRITI